MKRSEYFDEVKRADTFKRLRQIKSHFFLVLVCERDYHGGIEFMR